MGNPLLFRRFLLRLLPLRPPHPLAWQTSHRHDQQPASFHPETKAKLKPASTSPRTTQEPKPADPRHVSSRPAEEKVEVGETCSDDERQGPVTESVRFVVISSRRFVAWPVTPLLLHSLTIWRMVRRLTCLSRAISPSHTRGCSSDLDARALLHDAPQTPTLSRSNHQRIQRTHQTRPTTAERAQWRRSLA